MITAHLPSGYIVGRTAQRYGVHPWLMPAALVGAMLPDLDLYRFYLMDGRATHPHHAWAHIPGVWLVVAAMVFPLLHWTRAQWLPPARAFFVGIFVHLLLDSTAGSVKWAWPVSERTFGLATFPAPPHELVTWSHIFHWTFSLELLIWALAIYLYFKDFEP